MSDYWDSDEWGKMKVDLIMVRGAQCEWCGKRTLALVPHHLHYKNYRHEEPKDLALICQKCHAIEHGKIKFKKPRKTNKERKEERKTREAVLKLMPKKRKPATFGSPVKRVCPLCRGYLTVIKQVYSCACGYTKQAKSVKTIREEQAEKLRKTLIGILNGKP